MKTADCCVIAAVALICVADARGQAPQSSPAAEPPKKVAAERLVAGSREWHRDRTSRSYLDMEEELGIDNIAREKVIDAINDHHLAQRETFRDSSERVRKRAQAVTRMLSEVRAAIGEERMEDFYVYMHSDSARHFYGMFKSKLPAHAAISKDQKRLLMAAVTKRHAELRAYQPETFWAPAQSTSFTNDEQEVISKVNAAMGTAALLQKASELNVELEDEAAAFLSSEQLNVLKLIHEQSSRDSQRSAEQMHRPIDPAMFANLQQRVSALPRFQPPALLPRDVRVAIEMTINDRSSIAVTRSLRNGESMHIETDDLWIEVTPKLYDSGLSVEFAWFATIAGQRGRIEAPASSTRSIGLTHVHLSAVEGVKEGYFVRSSVRLLD